MANTGIKTVLTLRKYVDGVATNETKVNDPSDPDYIAPYEDLVDCPTAASTTQTPTTATTGTTQATTATTETTGTTQATTATTETTGTTQSTTATTETTGTTQATTATTASTQATTATTASTQATTATTASTQATTATTATTAIPCYNYQADVPQQSGESLEVTYIDCDGVEQSFVYYWNSGNTSVQWCARSIVGSNYPVTGPFNECGGNTPLPTTQATTATTATPQECVNWYNNTGTASGVSYQDCATGDFLVNQTVFGGDDICAVFGTFDEGTGGSWTNNGPCTILN